MSYPMGNVPPPQAGGGGFGHGGGHGGGYGGPPQHGGYGGGPPQHGHGHGGYGGPPRGPPQQQGYGGPPWYQQQQAQGYGQQSPYGNYGQYMAQNVFAQSAWQAVGQAHGGEQELWNMFSTEMNRSRVNQERQAIQAEELMRIMNNTPQIKSYYRINWSMELCKIMLAMMDRNPDGFMQWQEFKEMLQCIYHWFNTFTRHDFDKSGFIEAHELNNVIKSFGYTVSAKCMEALLKRYSRVVDHQGQTKCLIAFDDFISLCIRLRAYTDAFRKRDQAEHSSDTGFTTFGYDDFLQCVLCL